MRGVRLTMIRNKARKVPLVSLSFLVGPLLSFDVMKRSEVPVLIANEANVVGDLKKDNFTSDSDDREDAFEKRVIGEGDKLAKEDSLGEGGTTDLLTLESGRGDKRNPKLLDKEGNKFFCTENQRDVGDNEDVFGNLGHHRGPLNASGMVRGVDQWRGKAEKYCASFERDYQSVTTNEDVFLVWGLEPHMVDVEALIIRKFGALGHCDIREGGVHSCKARLDGSK